VKLILRISLLAAAASLGAVATLEAAPAGKAASRDWSKVVAASPDGGFRIGNPNAPVKLVEYGSLTCSHCAHFEEEGVPPLIGKYVKSGRVSFEFRNYVRDQFDLAGAMLSRCAGTRGYFGMTGKILATQEQWFGRVRAVPKQDMQALQALPLPQQLTRVAQIAGFDGLAAAHGLTPAKAKTCLANAQAVERLTQMKRIAVEQHGVQGTPSFLINGKTAEGAHDWAALEPLLAAPPG
jgi:protein-disulfide isomerase